MTPIRAAPGRPLLLATALASLLAFSADAQSSGRRPLAAADVDDIARLVMLEDRRQLDDTAVARMLRSAHPEVRRRAALAVGRIGDARGRALLTAIRNDLDTAVIVAFVFSTGQLADTTSAGFLASILPAPEAPVPIAMEAARALGKIRTPEARAGLAAFLASAPATAPSAVIGEALLSIGRFTQRGDLAPIARWTTSPDTAVRWRAAWALMRPRDPAAVSHLLRVSEDSSPDVRFWSVRGLAAPLADSAGIAREVTAARLRAAVQDSDRRVRAEALRALGSYDDDASFRIVLDALDSPDSWISVSAAEALARFQDRAATVVPRLIAAGRASRPRALRITALQSLVGMSPDAARTLATVLATDSSATAQQAATQVLRRLDAQAASAATPGQGARAAGSAGGSGSVNAAGSTGTANPASGASAATSAQGSQPVRQSRGADTTLTLAHYRRIVDRWVVPAYNGAASPRVAWTTPRGTIEIELYPGDTPLATDYFMRLVESGSIVGTEFGRVVPNFVAQQRTITGAVTLRDEVNLRGLTRGNLSWASAGLDTGRPGYTLGSTPQPHNEGGFTALGRVVQGMDVVDRLELGDAVTRVVVLTAGR